MPMCMASVFSFRYHSQSMTKKYKKGGSCLAAAEHFIFRLRTECNSHSQNHGLLLQPINVQQQAM